MNTPSKPPFGPDYGVGLYVHWPYCTRICPYCDFNVYAAKDRDAGPLVEAIIEDMHAHRALLGPGYAPNGLDSLYFGGGTPSLIPETWLAALKGEAHGAFGVTDATEVTLEANPNDILGADLHYWKQSGINRLSIGIQSLDDGALAFLGRDHDSANARRAVEAALKVFDNVSIDLIYAHPGQSPEEWQAELSAALALGAPHLSLYELTIEEKTAFGKAVARGAWKPMDEEAQADLYELTQEVCEAAGLPAYEVSNHARGPEWRSRHNQIYWQGGDWIGVGPGAHGRLTLNGIRQASLAPLRPADYLNRGAAGSTRPLGTADTARELLAMGLRDCSGFDASRLDSLGFPLDPRRTEALVASGHLGSQGHAIWLTQTGRLLADHITAQLAP